jgi:CBS-domain-containing membrane protein
VSHKRKVRPLTKQGQSEKTELSEQQMSGSGAAQMHAARASVFEQGGKNKRQSVTRAAQIMSSPVFTLDAQMSFTEAWQHFRQKNIRHFVVTDKQNMVQGILSDRDLLKHAAVLGATPSAIEKNVGQIMIDAVVTASADTLIKEVCRVMFDQNIGALPIVSNEGYLQGIVTRSDILRSMIKNGPLELWV